MKTKKDLMSTIETYRQLVAYLQARLCADGHDWIMYTKEYDKYLGFQPVYLCSRCLKRHKGIFIEDKALGGGQ